jgi:MoaD family protein
MMVRFFASLREITQDKEIQWDQCPSTLGELLRRLSERYGPRFQRWVFDGEDLGNSVLVVINGRDARHCAGLETRLAPADVISILPMMAGGQDPGSFLGVGRRRRTGRLLRLKV